MELKDADGYRMFQGSGRKLILNGIERSVIIGLILFLKGKLILNGIERPKPAV